MGNNRISFAWRHSLGTDRESSQAQERKHRDDHDDEPDQIDDAVHDHALQITALSLKLRQVFKVPWSVDAKLIDQAGQAEIAGHAHATWPGLVMVISGAWGEGRPSGEAVFRAGTSDAIVEDEIIER